MASRSAVLVASALAASSLFACSRSKVQEPPASDRPVPTTSASGPAPSAVATPLSARISRPAPAKLVGIGDLHGDLDSTRRALRLAGAIDDKDAWIGGDLVVVQTGDEIDRGDDDRAILDLFERLKTDAKKTGGEVIALVGNHELMNASLDYRYVTPGGFSAFADVHATSAKPEIASLGANERGRASAFAPGGSYAAMIAERPLFVMVGDTAFVHGGILPKHVRYGLDRMNDEVRAWLRGERPECPAVVASEAGPLWTRMYSEAPSKEDCGTLEEALKLLGAKRMVVGHTVQRNGVSPACADHVWRIDTGMSKAYGGKIEVLDIRGAVVTVRREGSAANDH